MARRGEAEPAGRGEAWRWVELARSDSYTRSDRKGLWRRPEQRHARKPQACDGRERGQRESRQVEQRSRGHYDEVERQTVQYDYERARQSDEKLKLLKKDDVERHLCPSNARQTDDVRGRSVSRRATWVGASEGSGGYV